MKRLLFSIVMSIMTITTQAQPYHLDVNNDGHIQLTDALIIINYLLGRFNPEYATLSLSSYELFFSYSFQSTVSVISGSGAYSVESSDNNVATANVNGTTITVTPIGVGTATIIVTDTKSGKKANVAVTVSSVQNIFLTCPDEQHPHLIDLGLPSGTKWACCNVGATIPEGYGGYYAWGETEEKTTYNWSTYIHCDGSSSTCHNLGSDIAGTQYDVAHEKWGSSWVMPSLDQIKELRENCTSKWTTVNGVNCWNFRGSNGGSIFLPAAGHRWNDDLYIAGSYVAIWSSTHGPSNSNSAYYLYYRQSFSSDIKLNKNGRSEGLSVRPVSR